MRLALVLAGGGMKGVAWEAGLLKGLRDAGAIDLGRLAPSIQGQSGPLDGLTEATELPADRLFRGPHRGLGPALRGRKTTTLVDVLPKGGDSLRKPCVGYVGDRDGLPVEYAGWVRIVGT